MWEFKTHYMAVEGYGIRGQLLSIETRHVATSIYDPDVYQ